MKAIEELSQFILYRAKVCKALGYSYHAAANAPESFEALKRTTINKHIVTNQYAFLMEKLAC